MIPVIFNIISFSIMLFIKLFNFILYISSLLKYKNKTFLLIATPYKLCYSFEYRCLIMIRNFIWLSYNQLMFRCCNKGARSLTDVYHEQQRCRIWNIPKWNNSKKKKLNGNSNRAKAFTECAKYPPQSALTQLRKKSKLERQMVLLKVDWELALE